MLSTPPKKLELVRQAQDIASQVSGLSNRLEEDIDLETFRFEMQKLAELVEAICSLLPED